MNEFAISDQANFVLRVEPTDIPVIRVDYIGKKVPADQIDYLKIERERIEMIISNYEVVAETLALSDAGLVYLNTMEARPICMRYYSAETKPICWLCPISRNGFPECKGTHFEAISKIETEMGFGITVSHFDELYHQHENWHSFIEHMLKKY